MERMILVFSVLLVLAVGSLAVGMPSRAETANNLKLILK